MALICAVIAAIAYELLIKVTVRKITARLPFVLLRLTRLMMSGTKWRLLHPIWQADLYETIDNPDGTALGRYLAGLRFSLSLVAGGAIRTARETRVVPLRQRMVRWLEDPKTGSTAVEVADAIRLVVRR
ncbi:hypothetical protein ACIRBX_34030 [Kitasatospora sp. NPDC096147]|uniref:hypothetical protein n=1 Tax=Kitasatospora sp. NPDC096147 TaxID=3364093 RepID=UPI0038247828